MAANLLLEGPDLEALLLRAHQEGGAQARIVRAEKKRRGGVFGFFAREGFEVAVEIPPTTGESDGVQPDGASAAGAASAAPEPATGPDDARPVTEAVPIPAGLIGLAERVSDEERHTETVPRVPEFRFAEAALGAIPAFEPAVFPDHESWPAATTGPIGLPAVDPQPAARSTAGRASGEPAGDAGDAAAPSGDNSPLRPQFTALIDQLRVGVRDGRHREEGVRHTADHPVVAALHAGLEDTHQISTANIVSALEAEAWAQVRTAATAAPISPETGSEPDFSAITEPVADVRPVAEPVVDVPPVIEPVIEPGADVPPAPPINQYQPTHEVQEVHEVPEHTEHTDQAADPAPSGRQQVPSNRNVSIVPSKPVKRSRRNVPTQRHIEPEQAPEQVVDRTAEVTPGPDQDGRTFEPIGPIDVMNPIDPIGPIDLAGPLGPDPAAGASPSGAPQSESFPDGDEPGGRWAGWWRLGMRRKGRAEDETTELWTAEDDARLAADTHWSAVEEAEDGALPGSGVANIPVPAGPVSAGTMPAAGFTAAAMSGRPSAPAAATISAGSGLAEDRQTLRDLGIPAAWTRRLQPGDRFGSILAILDLPEVSIPEDARVIAVVGPADVVQLEAHRTALDLPADGRPRQVVALPATDGKQRKNAIGRALSTRPVVVAIPLETGEDPERARAAATAVGADALIAIVDADQPLEAMTRFIESLGRIDAIALDGALEAEQPAAVLSLDVPVVRLDGISVDRIGWAALLCAQLFARDPQLAQAG